MSHGAGQSEVCDPNLTPMLDLVLQILMFFIITANLTADRVRADVELPESQIAKPVAAEKEPIFVNLIYQPIRDRDGKLTGLYEHVIRIPGKEVMDQAAARNWIIGKAEDQGAQGQATLPVVIRAHKSSEYAQVYQLLQSCTDAGFRNLKVRAIAR